jgi:hypothetical protein
MICLYLLIETILNIKNCLNNQILFVCRGRWQSEDITNSKVVENVLKVLPILINEKATVLISTRSMFS